MNKITTTFLGRGLLTALSIGLAGCSLSKPYPPKQLFSIDGGALQSASASSSSPTLRVPRARVADPFSSREFHYLIAPNQFQRDYYATFVADPDRLLTSELIRWMSATGLYAAVVDASSTVKAERSLQCVVSQLYGDMSDPASPRAVIAARFFLLDESGVDSSVLFTRDYTETEPVDGTGADKLTEAWGRATKKMFEQLTTDLRAVR